MRTSTTCRIANRAVHPYIHHAFNVDTLLLRFFPDPLAFRALQAETATLISGSFALQLFARTVYPSSDLDLYLHKRHRRTVGRWLLAAGYKFAPTSRQRSKFEDEVLRRPRPGHDGHYAMPGIACIYTFHRDPPQGAPGERLKVQLIVAINTPMEVILGFHSSASSPLLQVPHVLMNRAPRQRA